MSRFNDAIFEMYKQGFLSATSVGFHPLKYAFSDDPQRRSGIDILEQELCEFSCVPVPANADALIEARSAGVDIGPVLHGNARQEQTSRAAMDRVKAWAERQARIAALRAKT
jgi:phage head maturation protease